MNTPPFLSQRALSFCDGRGEMFYRQHGLDLDKPKDWRVSKFALMRCWFLFLWNSR